MVQIPEGRSKRRVHPLAPVIDPRPPKSRSRVWKAVCPGSVPSERGHGHQNDRRERTETARPDSETDRPVARGRHLPRPLLLPLHLLCLPFDGTPPCVRRHVVLHHRPARTAHLLRFGHRPDIQIQPERARVLLRPGGRGECQGCFLLRCAEWRRL